MEPFRAGSPACAKCGALAPDTYAPNGDLVCRGCAGTMEANARLGAGQDTTKSAAVVSIVVGALLIVGGAVMLFSSGTTRLSARVVGLLVGLGIVAIAGGVQNLKSRSRS